MLGTRPKYKTSNIDRLAGLKFRQVPSFGTPSGTTDHGSRTGGYLAPSISMKDVRPLTQGLEPSPVRLGTSCKATGIC